MKLLSIVTPAYNEQESIKDFYDRIKTVLKTIPMEHEIIIVNDGSKDNTEQIVTELSKNDATVKLINFSRNFGHEAATSAGVNLSKGDAVVVIDSDLQDPPDLIPQMVQKWESGYDVVYGERDKRHNENIVMRCIVNAFYIFMSMMAETYFPKNTGDFRLMDRRIVNEFNKLKEKNRFFRGMISWLGFKQTGLKFKRENRSKGKTKYNFFNLFRLALDSITSFSTQPLFAITLFGLFISLASFILGAVFILIKIFFQFPISGWTSLAVIILFMSGFQILLIGIVGEYIARMSIELKDRPLYLIRDVVSSGKRSINP